MPNVLATLQINIQAVLPELILVLTTLLIMMVDAFSPEPEEGTGRRVLPWLALIGIGAAAGASLWLAAGPDLSFQGQAVSDAFTNSIRLIVLIAAVFAVLMSNNYIHKVTRQEGEFYSLLLLAAAGMCMMGAATDLIVVFLALEIFSLALYILTGLNRRNARSTEAAMKYFLLGAFASAFFVYGAALLYGAAGSTHYDAIALAIQNDSIDPTLLYAGVALLVVGFGFKISLVPFHMWTPDVYQGAPTVVTAFMSVGTKAAGFAAFFRLFVTALPVEQPAWGWMLAILATVTMIIGNLAALRQVSLKRMLAYSSVAHAGYLMTALVPGTAQGANAALFYLFAYAFMNIGAFAVVLAVEKSVGDDYEQTRAKGLATRAPLLAFMMAIFMFSLSGIPPLAGFITKFYVFRAAVQGDWEWLAIVGMLTSAIGAYYYIRVIVSMYFEKAVTETEEPQPRLTDTLRLELAIAAAFTIVIGILPSLWSNFFQSGFGG